MQALRGITEAVEQAAMVRNMRSLPRIGLVTVASVALTMAATVFLSDESEARSRTVRRKTVGTSHTRGARRRTPVSRTRKPVVVARSKSPVKAAVKKSPAPAKTAEPAPVATKPVDYVEQTDLLARAYRLRDEALNDEIQANYGLAVKKLMDATQLSAQYYPTGSPAEALLYYELGRVAQQADRKDVAKQAFLQALERKPDLVDARVNLALIYAAEGRHAEALDNVRRAISAEPENSRAHLALSMLLEKQGNAAEAQSEKSESRRLIEPDAQKKPPEVGSPVPEKIESTSEASPEGATTEPARPEPATGDDDSLGVP